MSFTDQKPRIATEDDCTRVPWSGGKKAAYFRCYMCGHAFIPGDQWRWVYAGGRGVINVTVCEKCDGPDVLDRWVAQNYEAYTRFWWCTREDPVSKYEKMPAVFEEIHNRHASP